MKKNIHPKYVECTVTCGCGENFKTRATKPAITVEICSKCHPFYTGKQKFVDSAGQVEKFQKKFGWDEKKVAELELRKGPKKAPSVPKVPKRIPKAAKPADEASAPKPAEAAAKPAPEAGKPSAVAPKAGETKPAAEAELKAADQKPEAKPSVKPAGKPSQKKDEAGGEDGKKERKPAPKPKVVRRSPESLKEKSEASGESAPPAPDKPGEQA